MQVAPVLKLHLIDGGPTKRGTNPEVLLPSASRGSDVRSPETQTRTGYRRSVRTYPPLSMDLPSKGWSSGKKCKWRGVKSTSPQFPSDSNTLPNIIITDLTNAQACENRKVYGRRIRIPQSRARAAPHQRAPVVGRLGDLEVFLSSACLPPLVAGTNLTVRPTTGGIPLQTPVAPPPGGQTTDSGTVRIRLPDWTDSTTGPALLQGHKAFPPTEK